MSYAAFALGAALVTCGKSTARFLQGFEVPVLAFLVLSLERCKNRSHQFVPAFREAVVAEETARFNASGAVALPSSEFSVGSITIWHTPLGDSSCEEWMRVAEIPLQV